MTPEAKALEIVEFDDAFKLLSKKTVDRIHDAITQALRDVERETLERAAAKARAVFDANVGRAGTIAAVYTDCSAHIEQSIRSLLQKEGGNV